MWIQPIYLHWLSRLNNQHADEIEVEDEEREVPVDIEVGEAAPEDRVVEAPFEHDAVIVDGVSLSLSSSLANVRLGCESLGLSKRGGKEKCMKRMLEHVRAQELIAATSATVKIQRENARVPAELSRPVVPSQSMTDEHARTHYPYADWCETCVMHKARQVAHVVQGHDRKQHSVISFDFWFASRTEGDKLTVLFIHDQFTKLMGAIPTPQKGGKSLNYIVTEVVRFIMQTNHKEISLRCDCEPATLAILVSVQNFGFSEKECCEGRTIFGCNHLVYAWAVLHPCWIHNRFSVTNGSTPFEVCSGRMYTGRLARYGERVLGFLKTDLTGKPPWRPGIWLGKTTQNDTCIIAVAYGVFVTRSI